MPFTPAESLYQPATALSSPLNSGSSFLSGLSGVAGIASSFLNPVAGIAGLAGPLLSGLSGPPDNTTVTNDGRQSLGFQISNPFIVGKGNTLDNSPRLEASPVDSTATAPAAGSIAGVDGNSLVLIGAAILALILVLFGSRRS